MASTMKAWQYNKVPNKLENSLSLNTSVTKPPATSLSQDELLVEVITASINPADYKLPENLISDFIISKPATPGHDFCGRVTATHPSNTSFKSGQLVFGSLPLWARYGSCAQFLVVPSSDCAVLPEGVDIDQAAAIGIAGLTAHQSLLPEHVKPGSSVFIEGGSGRVGTFAIQFAKVLGVRVTTTCSTANVELCKSLGADEVIDYRVTDVITALKSKGQVFDVVIDNVGHSAALFNNCEAFLKPDGVFAQVAAEVTTMGFVGAVRKMYQPRFLGGVGRKFHYVVVKNKTEDYELVARWMRDGKVRAVIGKRFAFEDVPRAFEELREGHTKGKSVIRVGDK